jgi:polyphosphate kinase 2 (PPK2 family)
MEGIMSELDRYCYDGKGDFDLDKIDTDGNLDKDGREEFKEKIEQKTEANNDKLSALQDKLYADGKEGLVIILQAMDAAGKDSTIKRVMSGVNPQGVDVVSFKQPGTEELAHDFLWRVEKNIPARGKIGLFNR